MKKDKKNPTEEMSDKKRLQNLVWDGLFNALDHKSAEDKDSNTPKKSKKGKKDADDKHKPDDTPPTG